MLVTRKRCRSGDPCLPRDLAESIWCCVHHSRITAREIAERMNVRLGYLLDAASPDRDEHQFQSRWLLPLMVTTSNSAPLHYLARQLGGFFVELPAVGSRHDDIRTAFMRAVGELGEDAAVIETALQDDGISTEEAPRIEAGLDETIEALLCVKAAVRRNAIACRELKAVGR